MSDQCCKRVFEFLFFLIFYTVTVISYLLQKVYLQPCLFYTCNTKSHTMCLKIELKHGHFCDVLAAPHLAASALGLSILAAPGLDLSILTFSALIFLFSDSGGTSNRVAGAARFSISGSGQIQAPSPTPPKSYSYFKTWAKIILNLIVFRFFYSKSCRCNK